MSRLEIAVSPLPSPSPYPGMRYSDHLRLILRSPMMTSKRPVVQREKFGFLPKWPERSAHSGKIWIS